MARMPGENLDPAARRRPRVGERLAVGGGLREIRQMLTVKDDASL